MQRIPAPIGIFFESPLKQKFHERLRVEVTIQEEMVGLQITLDINIPAK
jgi:hypothetical protein